MGIDLKTVGRQGLQALALIAAAITATATAQVPKLRTPGIDCPVVKNADGSTLLVPCNRPDFVEKAPPPVFPYPNVPPPKLPEAPPQTHGLDLTINTDANAKAYHDWLCANDAGEFIFRTAENVEGYFEMRSREESYKIHLEKYGLYRPGNPWPNEPFSNDRYFWEDPLGLAWYPDTLNRFTAVGINLPQPDGRLPPSVVGYNLGTAYQFREKAIWRADLAKYGAARYFRYEPIFPAEAQITSGGNAVMPMTNPIVTKQTPVTEIRSQFGYFWRGLTRSVHDRAMGIAGGEIIIVALATNEVMAVRRSWAYSRRNPARRDPVEREAQSQWVNVYQCPTTANLGGTISFLQRVLKPSGIDPKRLPRANP